MNADVILPLLRIKQLRADRAESERRERKAALDAALAAAEEAQRTLAEWRADRPRKEAAIYDEVIGHLVTLDDLDDVTDRIVQLREHERVLEERLGEAQKRVREAQQQLSEAELVVARTRRDVSKFEEIVEALRRAGQIETDRREDLELEEFAKAQARDDDEEGTDEWDHAA